MARLTKRTVDAAVPTQKEQVIWDDAIPGFGLRVMPSGRRSYLIQYRVAGRSRRFTLGVHGTITPDQARRKAVRLLAAARDGADPAEELRDSRNPITVADLAERYFEEHAPKKKPTSVRSDKLNWRLHIKPKIGNVPLAALSRADITTLHHQMRGTPFQANRVVALLSKMLSLAERWGLRPDGSNATRHVERFREKARQRYLSEAELARLGDALAESESMGLDAIEAVAAIRLLLFTGARMGEILTLRWDDVDLEWRCLRLPDSKTGAKLIQLNAPALEVLASLKRRSEWVLPGKDPKKPYVNLAKPWARISQRAELDDVRVHDLRHSFAAVGAGAGGSLLVIGGLLGHKSAATTARYAHLSVDPLRAANEVIGSRIDAALRGTKPADVVPLVRADHE